MRASNHFKVLHKVHRFDLVRFRKVIVSTVLGPTLAVRMALKERGPHAPFVSMRMKSELFAALCPDGFLVVRSLQQVQLKALLRLY